MVVILNGSNNNNRSYYIESSITLGWGVHKVPRVTKKPY